MTDTFTDTDFAAVRDYLAAEAGLAFDEGRRAGLAAVVAERLRACDLPDVRSYVAWLSAPSGQTERQLLLDAVTVQETQFFRNQPQMQALRRRVLPELLRRAAGREQPLTIWSAGCSTGEEPYSLAMMLLELAPTLGATSGVRILGTDVSAEAVRAAGRATYTGRTLEPVPAMVRDRWMERRPGGAYAVKEQARRLVEFRLHNLVTDPPPFGRGEVDLVVCRNVTIYFGRDTTRLLVGTFHDVLAEGGYLLLGHSETLWQVSNAFALVPMDGAFVYRRAHDSRGRAPGRLAVPSRRARPRPPVNGSSPSRPPAEPTQPAPPELLTTARERLEAGDYPAAAAAAQQALTADPLLTPAYVVLGQARSTLGQDDVAVPPLRKAVYLDPADGNAHFLLAGALSRLGQHAAASVSYRAAARAVSAMPPERAAALLGGRDAGQLAALCERLADEAAARAGHPATSAGAGRGSAG
jgi:chemotaxis protein methyltransferase CheR